MGGGGVASVCVWRGGANNVQMTNDGLEFVE